MSLQVNSPVAGNFTLIIPIDLLENALNSFLYFRCCGSIHGNNFQEFQKESAWLKNRANTRESGVQARQVEEMPGN